MSIFSDIIDNLIVELKTIRIQAGYNTDLDAPLTYGSDIIHSKTFPAIAVTPNGSAEIICEDASDVRILRDIEISAAVSEKDQTANYEAILGISEDVRDLIYTPVDLGTGFLSIAPDSPHEDLVVLMDKGLLSQRWKVLYTESGIKPGTAPGSDVYGSNDVYDDVRSKIYSALNTFMLGDLAALSPKFSYIYDYHIKAALLLNGVTIEISSSDADRIGGLQSVSVMKHGIDVSIRIHTGYLGGEIKTLVNLRLLNSIETCLLETVDLSGGYHIDEITQINPSETFSDSATTGGSLMLRISKMGDYTQ